MKNRLATARLLAEIHVMSEAVVGGIISEDDASNLLARIDTSMNDLLAGKTLQVNEEHNPVALTGSNKMFDLANQMLNWISDCDQIIMESQETKGYN